MREMTDTGNDCLTCIPAEWSHPRLKYYCKISNGADPQTEGNIPAYGSGKEVVKYCGEYKEGPAILLGRKGTLDNPRYVEGKFWNVDTAMDAYPINGINPRFLFFITTILDIQRYATSTAKPSMTQGDYYNMPIPVPSREEQDSIVAFIDSKCASIDEAIERHKKIIEKLEEYRGSAITASVTLSSRAEQYKTSKTYAQKIPNHWREANLGNLVYSMRNGYVGPTRDILVDDGVRYIQSLHVKNGKLLFENGPFYVSEEWGNVHPKIKTGDVLIVQTGDIGQVAVVTEEYNDCNCHALIIARTRTDIILPEYLAYYFRSRVGITELLLTATGATLPHLNSGAIKYSKVIIPPIPEQEEIIELLHQTEAKIDVQIEAHKNIIGKLEEYRKSIIYYAVTGKIDCREASA